MKALYYWIIVFVFVLFSTIIGLFLFPFIHWLFGFEDLYIVLLCLGGVLLVSSLFFYLKRKKKNNKISAMIIFPIALFFTIGGIIHNVRFEGYTKVFDGYLIQSHDAVYNKFGVRLVDIEYHSVGVGTDVYGNELLVTYVSGQDSAVKVFIYDQSGDFCGSMNVDCSGVYYYGSGLQKIREALSQNGISVRFYDE